MLKAWNSAVVRPHHKHKSLFHHQIRNVSAPIPGVDPTHLRRVCTTLYQQQNSPDSSFYSNLCSINFSLSHEFFIQVCNKFPFSWRPIFRFFNFSQTQPTFSHSHVTFNKMLDVYGRSRNIDLLWDFTRRTAQIGLATDSTFILVTKHLGAARELNKCLQFFHLMNENGFSYSERRLNMVVDALCGQKMVEEAKYIVFRMKPWIKVSEVTYGFLVSGFCQKGDLVEACKIWNLMVDEGLQPEVGSSEKIIERLFKSDRFEDGMVFFRVIKLERNHQLGLSIYKLLVTWMCKKGKLFYALMMFDEMFKRGIGMDDQKIVSSLVTALLIKGRAREAFKLFQGIQDPDLGVYNDLIKGLLKLRKTSEATQVLREMCCRGCEPNMHTYIMLLQGHLGKRGRKGPHPEVNFESIFVGGLVKLGKTLEAAKYVERMIKSGVEVPRFDYNKFLYNFSNEEGVGMFEEVGRRLREVGMLDLGDVFLMYGERMATRDRRRKFMGGFITN